MVPSVRLCGLGIHLPEASLTNEDLEKGMPWLGTSAQWIEEHTGIHKRHVAEKGQNASDLGFLAAEEALRHSKLRPEDIDLVLLATNTSEYVYPAGAARIQSSFGQDGKGRLRMRKAGCLDLQQGCASFVGGIGMAMGMISGGLFRNILVVGADVATRMVDWTDRDSILLGDAAAACVLTSDPPPGGVDWPGFEILGHFMRTDSSMADTIRQRGVLNVANYPFDLCGAEVDPEKGNLRAQLYPQGFFGGLSDEEHCFFAMEGRQVYRFVIGIVPRQGYLEVMRSSGILDDVEAKELGIQDLESLEEIKDRKHRRKVMDFLGGKVDLFVPHSANLSLNQELAVEMGIPFERMYVTLHKYANTSAASVGLSLYEALRQESRYVTLTKRDGKGRVKVPGREVVAPMIGEGQTALLLSFGAGNSWNYLVVRRN